MSTDFDTIRFFGNLMPALLLLFRSPLWFVRALVARRTTPRGSLSSVITRDTDDFVRVGTLTLFLHRWHTESFDAVAFARARIFLARAARMAAREGMRAEVIDPLSPATNLPALAAMAGLGTLSPFGLLVHPRFGPRLIISGLRTDRPLEIPDRAPGGAGCTDCMACIDACPQKPRAGREVRLADCRGCNRCLAVCPIGAGGGEVSPS